MFGRSRIVTFELVTAPAHLWIALWCFLLGFKRTVRIGKA